MSDLHTFEELALALGRFEMESTFNQGNMQYKSLIGVDEALVLGLFDAPEIVACEPETTSDKRRQLLDSLGERVGRHWKLQPPTSSLEVTHWKKLLVSDQALIIVASEQEGWLENLIGNLHAPLVATIPSMSLTEAWLSFERRAFNEGQELLHISTGVSRVDFTFVGNGPLYAKAVALAAYRPQMMWGYPPAAFKETLRSRKLIFPAKKAEKTGS